MAAFSHVVLLLLIYSIQKCSAQNESVLTFQPPKIQLTPNTTSTGTEITISCAPPAGAGSASLLGISISRVNKSQQLVELARALGTKNNGQAQLSVSMQGVSVSGAIDERKISLEMSRASCSDEGVYVCSVTYYLGAIQNAKSEKELKVEVSPGEITMASSPLNPNKMWKENDTLTLTCSGAVGSVNTTGSTNDPQIRWQWEYRQSGLSWSPYDGDDSDVNTRSLISQSCYKTQTSILTRRLTLRDSQREYRCYVVRGSQGFTQFAQSYSVGSVTASGATEPPDNTTGASKANVGAIVGGTFGALIVVAVVVIIVFFLVIRPRRRKAQEGHVTEDPDSLDEKGTAPPTSAAGGPEVVYSQPSRHGKDKNKKKKKHPEDEYPSSEGVTNKGLDVSAEKQPPPNDSKLPPDNDDKRHGRRHKDKKQPATQYEIDPRVEDYDPHYAKLDRDPHRGHADEKPSQRRGRDNDPPNEDNNRRRRHRPRDDDRYDDRPARYDDDYGQGRRNRGYEHDNRRRGHHSSSEDGGMDSFVNTSQFSVGDGDPTIGTAI